MSELKEKVILEIKKIYDPEIPVNIYELGLIYNINIDEKNKVKIDMTLLALIALWLKVYLIVLKIAY